MRKIIFITGKAGSGKDTVAKYLKNNYNFTVFRYADKLKEFLISVGWDGKKDLKGRKILQAVGKAFRDYDQNFWINKLFIDVMYSTSANICIADVRHENEFEYFDYNWKVLYPETKSILLKIIGPKNSFKRDMDKETLLDVSEIGMDNYKGPMISILNETTKENLYLTVDTVIKSVFGD